MKKIVLGLFVLVVGFVGFKINNYYQATYKGQEYFVRVPSDVDTSLEKWQSGGFTITGRRYTFNAVNEQGERRELNIAITDDNGPITEADLFHPGQYIRVEASERRVLNWHIISENDVPKDIINYVN